jgi:hypothetical protein
LRLLWGISTQRRNDVKDQSGKTNNALGMYERSTLASLQVQVNHQAGIECYKQAGSTFPRRQRRTRTWFLSHMWEYDVREDDTSE